MPDEPIYPTSPPPAPSAPPSPLSLQNVTWHSEEAPPPLSAPALMASFHPAPSASPSPIFMDKGRALRPASGPFLTSPTSLLDRTSAEIWTDHLTELEQWAKANQRDARHDAVAFWALKIPAIVASASAGISAQYHLTNFSLFAAAIASFCVIVDGIQPRGILRNIHLRAYHDIRFLTSHMMTQLRSSEDRPENAVRKIIRDSEPERKRIAAYIRDAESALKSTGKA